MQLKNEQKKLIAVAIAEDLKAKQAADETYSQASHSRFLKINQGIYSRVVRGDVDKTLSSAEWVRIGKKLYVDLNGVQWKTAKTAVLEFVTGQLAACQKGSLSAINCDLVGIGKTHAAEEYARRHRNVMYIRCEEGITRADLVRLMAQSMGLDSEGTISSIRHNIELHLYGLDKPLIILDDAGYLNDRAWMTIKGIYDATEGECGMYIIGDTSLRKKMERLIHSDKSGWEALFDRFNRKYQAITELYESPAELEVMRKACAVQILDMNMPNAERAVKVEVLKAAGMSLRVLRKEVMKRRAA